MDLLHNLAPHMLVVISINLLYIVVKTSPDRRCIVRGIADKPEVGIV